MDTKSKKSKLYSKRVKAFAVFLVFLSTITAFLSGVYFLELRENSEMSPFYYNDYYETSAFQDQYSQLVRDAVNVNIIYQNEENIKSGGAINERRLLQDFGSINGIDPEAILYDIDQDGILYLYIDRTKLSENSLPYDQALDILESNYPQFRQNVIEGQLSDFKASKKELEEYTNFQYALVNEEEGITYGNNEPEVIQKQNIQTTIDTPYTDGYAVTSTNYYFDYDESGRLAGYYYYDNYQDSIEDILKDSGFVLYAGINNELVPGDKLYSQYHTFYSIQEQIPYIVGACTVSATIALIFIVYLIVFAGRQYKGGPVQLAAVDHVYNDIQTIFVVVVSFFFVLFFVYGVDRLLWLTHMEVSWTSYLTKFFLSLLVAVELGIVLSYLTSISRQIKAKCLFRNTVVSVIIRKIGMLFSGKTFKGWIVFILFAYAAVNIFLTAVFFLSSQLYGGMLPMLILGAIGVFNILAAFFCIRALRSLSRIMVAVKETSKGNINYTLNIQEISPSFMNFATDVEQLQTGLKKAVQEAVKGERMKADLITNVSHDLKTPLTSIITYVDLLKNEKLENETAQGYVDILDEKSHRLKQLIEDLIEASKASSGNIAVHKVKIDLRQLVMQATGEFEEKIDQAGLNFIINSPEETCICADGKHMWRIIENLISNAIKYSMANTRVYVDILKSDQMGILVIKNISSQPITVSSELLTERFMRGDESRTTEGSGLGLSIAKSLVDLQGGSLHIAVDGDLFKVSVKMPLWIEPEIVEEKEQE